MKKLLLLFAIPILAWSQATVIQSPTPQFRSFLPSGAPNASGCVYTFASGTSTPQATYTDFTGNTPNTNPVILDGTGSANIWITSAVYRVQVWSFGSGSVGSNCGNGTQLYQVDGVKDTGLNAFGTGPITINAVTNGVDLFSITRATDVSPTGNFINFKSFAGTPLFKVDITGALSTGTINGLIMLDGNHYPLTVAGLQSALSDCNSSSSCTGVDARQLGVVTSSSTITIPTYKTLWLGNPTTITGTSDPVVCYNTGSAIIGTVGEETVGAISAIRSSNAAARVLAPCAPNPRTLYFYTFGMDYFNTSAAATAAVVDFTGCSHCRIDNSFIVHSGGSGDLVFITIATGNDAFYNIFYGDKLFGSGTGAGYHVTNAANSQVIIGGKIDTAADCILADGTTGQVNEISVHGTACEAQTASVIHTISNVLSVRWFGGRWESSTGGAQLFNISATSGHIEAIGVGEFGTQVCGTTNSNVTIIGAIAGFPCASNFDIFTPRSIFAQFYSANGATSTFVNATGDSASFSSDSVSNSAGVQFIDTHAGGHNWRLSEGQLVNVGHFNIRDLTQTGQPGFGFQVTGTTASEGLFTHALTASRTWTMPDVTGQVDMVAASTSQKAETGAADANVLTFTPAAVAATYRVCVSINVSSATAGVISWTLSWQDPNANVQTNIAQPLFQFGTAAPNTTFTTSSVSGYTGCTMIDENSATPIVVKWVGGGTTAAKMSATIEKVI